MEKTSNPAIPSRKDTTTAVISIWHRTATREEIQKGLIELLDSEISYDKVGRTLKLIDPIGKAPFKDLYGLTNPLTQVHYSVLGTRPVDLEIRQICNLLKKHKGAYCQAHMDTGYGEREIYTSPELLSG